MRNVRADRGHTNAPGLDTVTAGRLLDGRLTPAEAPPHYAAVARLLQAAAAPGRPEELAGEPAALQAFRAGRRRRGRTRVRLAVVGVAAMVAMSGLAVASGLPSRDGGAPGRPDPRTTAGTASPSSRPGAAGRDTAAGAVSDPHDPGLASPVLRGQCTAWLAGPGRHGRAAPRALVQAAGGAGNVDAWCQAAAGVGGPGGGNPPEHAGSPGGGKGNTPKEKPKDKDDTGDGGEAPPTTRPDPDGSDRPVPTGSPSVASGR
jgi:hypothetical protein